MKLFRIFVISMCYFNLFFIVYLFFNYLIWEDFLFIFLWYFVFFYIIVYIKCLFSCLFKLFFRILYIGGRKNFYF